MDQTAKQDAKWLKITKRLVEAKRQLKEAKEFVANANEALAEGIREKNRAEEAREAQNREIAALQKRCQELMAQMPDHLRIKETCSSMVREVEQAREISKLITDFGDIARFFKTLLAVNAAKPKS